MVVFLAVANPRDAARLSRTVSARGYTVVMATEDPENELPSVECDVAVVQRHPDEDWLGAAARAEGIGHVLAVLKAVDRRSVAHALDAGADDTVALRACAEELIARVELPQRLARRAAPPALPATFVDLVAWSNASDSLSQEIGGMLGIGMTAGPGQDVPLTYAAELTATSVETSLELVFTVGVTRTSARSLVKRLFGETLVRDVIDDLLCEVANTVAGAFKRLALAEGRTLSLGLPVVCPPAQAKQGDQVWVALHDDSQVHVSLSQVSTEVCRLPARSLAPGMVIRHDVRNGSGMVMVRAGSRLTERTTQRLLELCGGGPLLEVVVPRRVEGLAVG